MAAQALFGNKITPMCRYCEYGCRYSARDNTVLCEKKGVVSAGYKCGRFRYDPLKRVPRTAPELQKFKPSDFAL